MPDAAALLRIGAAYIRVSTDEQAELSPDSQLRLIKDYAAAHDIIIPEQYVYLDEGISGRNTKKRDAFNDMIATAKLRPRPFDVILVWKFSRFARSREDSVVYKSMLRRDLGIDVVSISEPVGEDKTSVLMEAIIEAMDEYYSINLAEEVKRGMTEKAMRGGLQSAPPYGYRSQANALVPVPEEADDVREIFRRFAAGEGYFAIARSLNARGRRTHRGNLFENRSIEYIIRNPAYIGRLRWNPSGRSRRNFDDPNIITADAGHPPIVSEELWEQAQRQAEKIKAQWRPHQRPSTEHRDWASGLLRCSACGRSIIKANGPKTAKGSGGYWKCEGYSKGRCDTSQHVTDEKIKSAIIERMQHDATSATFRYSIIRPRTPADPSAIDAELQLQRLSGRLNRLRDAYLDGAETLTDYKAAKARIENEMARLRSASQSRSGQGPTAETDRAMRQALLEAVAVLQSPGASMAEKHTAAHQCIEHCVWCKEKNTLDIHYRLTLI